MTLEGVCAQYGLNLDLVKKALAAENIRFREGMSLRQIAELNNLSPIDVYGKIREAAEDKERR